MTARAEMVVDGIVTLLTRRQAELASVVCKVGGSRAPATISIDELLGTIHTLQGAEPPALGPAVLPDEHPHTLPEHGQGSALPALQAESTVWAERTFGAALVASLTERAERFLEEACELVQAAGMPTARAHELVDYVFSREPGRLPQELGGTMMTLAVLASACGLDLTECWQDELAECWLRIDAIREKNLTKAAAITAARGEVATVDCPVCAGRASTMVGIGGKRFRCSCGCNVFHGVHDLKLGCLLVCNACGAEYQGA